MVQRVRLSVRYGGAAGAPASDVMHLCIQTRSPPGSSTICTRQMSGSTLSIYKPVVVRCFPLLYLFYNPRPPTRLSLPQSSSLRYPKRDVPSHSLPPRVLLLPGMYTTSFDAENFVDLDTFPVDICGLHTGDVCCKITLHSPSPRARSSQQWRRLLRYVIPYRHRCSDRTLTLVDVSPDRIIAEIIAVAGLTIIFVPIL